MTGTLTHSVTAQPSIGRAIPRVDGRLKVTGAAEYSGDMPLSEMAHAVILKSTIAKGQIQAIDTTAANQLPGVLTILTHENAPRLNPLRGSSLDSGAAGEKLVPLQDNQIHFEGQHIGIVIAETLEQAKQAASLVQFTYRQEQPTVDLHQENLHFEQPESYSTGDELQSSRGDVNAAIAEAEAWLESNYETPMEHHNPMETSATIAFWQGDELTLYDATQWIMGTRAIVAGSLGLSPESVRVIAKFVGGGFGCKGFFWSHTLLAAIAARKVNRPVKLVLTRHQMFNSCGHRPPTIQAVTLGAKADGTLTAIRHITHTQTSEVGDHTEPCGLTTRLLYACPNLEMIHRVTRFNTPTPTPMRGPGEASGTFALESAMDELAYELHLDPVELRIRNHADVHPHSGKPWSSKHLIECYRRGAELFGWSQRDPRPGSMQTDETLIGWGMATATYPGFRYPAAAKAQIFADGRVVSSSATHDIGTGTYTVMRQVAADALCLPLDRVQFDLGDSQLSKAPVSGGSGTVASVGSAVRSACEAVALKLINLAIGDRSSPLSGYPAEEIVTENGRIFVRNQEQVGETFETILQRHDLPMIEAEVSLLDTSEEAQKEARNRAVAACAKAVTVDEGAKNVERFAFQSFGAQFVEVQINPRRNQVRVTRMVGVFDAGRILNSQTAHSQLYGGMIFGVGMALMEETLLDPQTGKLLIHNLADYHVPIQADIHNIEVEFVEHPDYHFNPLGARGIGEIGTTGIAAAIANAVYHATGKRVRQLPITPDKLL
jgi:xanthine dehydrogenase YagR molybdenum-binding subunit